MAAKHATTRPLFLPTPYLRQQQLLSLIARICEPRERVVDSDRRRLVVDSRLDWALEPIDGQSSWMYLPHAARIRDVAGCLILSAD